MPYLQILHKITFKIQYLAEFSFDIFRIFKTPLGFDYIYIIQGAFCIFYFFQLLKFWKINFQILPVQNK
jgi:hypothetical protein